MEFRLPRVTRGGKIFEFDGGIDINLVEFSSFIISFFGTSRMPYPTIGGSFVFGYRR